ncbi:NAD-dependent epimerase/dehydratase family protein [Reichenbachiella sp.]|uniref:NAD-dependent epimerase/dehydratase family protein n=1 Tax=Reichenbachiella sp. TaxID=2184521 RepID=UPI003B5B7FE0
MNNIIAITGGTGHIGTALIELLIQEDYLIRALYHRSLPILAHKNLTWIQGDINDSITLSSLFSEAQIVVHCAALVSIDDHNTEKLFQINVEGTQAVINACLKKQAIRLIHISSSDVAQSKSEHDIFDESVPYKNDDTNSYEASKIKAEKAIIAAVKTHDLDAVILRPTAVVGPPDYHPSLLGETIYNLAYGNIPMLTTGGYDMIEVRDLCQTIINSFDKARKGEIYLLCGSFCSIEKMAKLANPHRSWITIPTQLLLAIYPIVRWYLKITKSNLPLTRKSLLTLQQSPRYMVDNKAKKELNHKCRSIESTISDLLKWNKEEFDIYE